MIQLVEVSSIGETSFHKMNCYEKGYTFAKYKS